MQYPLVELTAGLVFVFSYLFWPENLTTTGQIIFFTSWLLTSTGLLALFLYDYKWKLLPNRILYPTAGVAMIGRFAYIMAEESNKWSAMAEWAMAVAIASGIFWLIFHLSRGKWIGYGDVRLGLITGTVLANPGQSLLMIFVASVLGTLAVLPDLLAGRKTLTAKIPFGPFLILATFLVLLFGQPAIDWYLDLALQG